MTTKLSIFNFNIGSRNKIQETRNQTSNKLQDTIDKQDTRNKLQTNNKKQGYKQETNYKIQTETNHWDF